MERFAVKVGEDFEIVIPEENRNDFFKGVCISGSCFSSSRSYGVRIFPVVEFSSLEKSEAFKEELCELICRHTGGEVKK